MLYVSTWLCLPRDRAQDKPWVVSCRQTSTSVFPERNTARGPGALLAVPAGMEGEERAVRAEAPGAADPLSRTAALGLLPFS